MLLAQLQPMPEPALKLSLGTQSTAPATVIRAVKIPEHETPQTSLKKPVGAFAPMLADRPLAMQDHRLQSGVQLHLAVNASAAKGMTPLVSALAPAFTQGHAPASPALPSPPIPGVLVAQVFSSSTAPESAKSDQVAGASIAKADADISAKQEPPQSLPTHPLPLMDKPAPTHALNKPAATTKPASEPVPTPETSVGKGASNYLQVPFNRGAAVGLITVSKAGTERPDQLLLNPSNPSIFGHLSEGLAQVADPRWHLTDHQGHEHSGGHDQGRSDDDAEEGSGKAFKYQHEQGSQDT
ncbi:hypothetical protein C4K29_3816 [Pseudomonas chlororaphis subsp. piscium]|nr:hypothetical protein C4K29_3816 [Pseudomonas chlororaphis subsp. piscium]